MTITFTGEVLYAVPAMDTPEYGPLGASVELHIIFEPQADDAFRGLWRSEAGFSIGSVVTNLWVPEMGSGARLTASPFADGGVTRGRPRRS
jgi:hypothetical protein